MFKCFESHQNLAGMWKRRLGWHAGRQEAGRCCTRGESQGMCNITRMPLLSSNKAEPTLALKPRGDVTRSPKRVSVAPQKKDSCPPKIKKKKVFKCDFLLITVNYLYALELTLYHINKVFLILHLIRLISRIR